ncbi:hypothetical protein Dimus_018634 [Dionaea muscipula]
MRVYYWLDEGRQPCGIDYRSHVQYVLGLLVNASNYEKAFVALLLGGGVGIQRELDVAITFALIAKGRK